MLEESRIAELHVIVMLRSTGGQARPHLTCCRHLDCCSQLLRRVSSASSLSSRVVRKESHALGEQDSTWLSCSAELASKQGLT